MSYKPSVALAADVSIHTVCMLTSAGNPLEYALLQGPVLSVAADSSGRHMVTTGADGQVRIWDLRTYKPLHAYFSPSPATWYSPDLYTSLIS